MATYPATETLNLVTRSLHLPITSDPEAFGNMARATERVLVDLAEPGPEQRARLEMFVIAAIEFELARLGAAPPGWQPPDTLDAKLSDQLYRTRLLGCGGLALRFADLAAVADADGKLCPDDSDALRQLFLIAEREPLQLYLPERAAALRVIGAPQQLSDWLTTASRSGRAASIEYEDPALAPPQPAGATHGNEASEDDSELAPPPLAAFLARPAPATAGEDGVMAAAAGSLVADDAATTPVPASVAETLAGRESPSSQAPAPEDPQHAKRCSSWAAQLQAMSGPKVHGSVERAFLTAYLPLCREVTAGKAPAETAATVEKWAEGFAQSYAAAHKTLSTRAKRPKMVKDVVDIGVRWLNQYRARQCQLLLVDGMRFDLGQRVNEHIERRLGGRAQCVDQTLLWAALPSNSEAQQIGEQRLTLAKRSSRAGTSPNDTGPLRPSIESIRVGTREVYRLDQLASDLTHPGEMESARLERLAATLADTLVPWIEQQPADTLVVVFGDHGFYWQAGERSTSAAQCGGALPEQVLVPASAWLLVEARNKAGFAAGIH